ncbi:MFS transporter [Arthrobacter bambusae]|uniref:MFS transporter n=1 Tax=Arthrobacter bambusae TaxID=1338426 RepID=UPI001F50864D|nr:MFS transporter [Arthrobacter bambusae]MCI0142069.1 MFS transporter [Arthrobacter bambusae]
MAETSSPTRTIQAARPRMSLAVAMLGFFVVALDAQIVNVALPHIRDELSGGLSGLQWIVTGYTLMFSALQLFGGSISDRVGARRAFGIGMIVFVLGSAACGAAPSLAILIAGRVVQGIGAAMITPTSLALIREAFHDAVQRGRAITYWALGGSVASAAGPVVGGILTQVGWRWIFFVNLPVGVLALIVLARVAPSPRRAVPFDWAGQIAAIAALGGLTFAIIEGGSIGYGAPEVLAAFALAVIGAVMFLIAQARGLHPMMPLDLFRSTTVSIGLGIAFVTMAAFYGVVFVQSLYFQEQRGVSALITGLLFLPMTGLVALLNPFVARAMERLGKISTTIGGMTLMALGLLSQALLPADAPVIVNALLMVPVGLGGSSTVPPLTALILDHIPAERAGTASGVLNTARQMGGSLGIAIFGAVLATQTVFQAGLRIDYIVTGLVLLVLAAVTLRLRKAA